MSKKIIPLLIIVSMLAASCAPRMNYLNDKPVAGSNAPAEYSFVGFHKVCNSLAEDGSVAFRGFNLADPGFIVFKQVNADGSVSPIATACQ